MYGLFTGRDLSAAQTILRTGVLSGLMSLGAEVWAGDEIQFNTDILDLSDRTNIDLSQFSRSGFILPGVYPLQVQVNSQWLPEQRIAFYPPDDDPKGSQACLSTELVEQLGLKPEMQARLGWWKSGECLHINSLAGMEVSGDLATSSLHISVPQAYLEYNARNWDPPSRWDNGVPGVLMDYNLTAKSSGRKGSARQTDLSGNGTFGANAGPWRLRADWQGRIEDESYSRARRLEWSRFYAYRALPAIQARLTLGENYLYSNVFDSFRFTGVALNSDDNQLPPNLRGYAPEVVGVAKTNARVQHQPRRIHSLSQQTLHTLIQKQFDGRHHVAVHGVELHGLRITVHVHQAHPTRWMGRHHTLGTWLAQGPNVVDDVHPDHRLAPFQQPVGGGMADETGRAGDEDRAGHRGQRPTAV